ncbi:hypothetical protein CsSME_00003958 [Camellia sinensis var. sinensis]
MGSFYEGKKDKAKEEGGKNIENECMNGEGVCGVLGENTIREVLMKAGLLEEDGEKGGLGVKVEEQTQQPVTKDKVEEDEKINVLKMISESPWGAFEEEPMIGWIWYPYTHEELMSFQEEEEEVVWEHSLWNWDDINGIGMPNP